MAFLLARQGEIRHGSDNFCKENSGKVLLWHSEDKAEAYAQTFRDRNDRQQWYVKRATADDFRAINQRGTTKSKFPHQLLRYVDEEQTLAQPNTDHRMRVIPIAKSVSTLLLVDVFEDFTARRFAIASRAENEIEFIDELAQALSASPCQDWKTRLQELLPLAVDMCCKYRGYKAESVQERRELIAGDLDIPRGG